jgi:AcrR family transcriptional regulator
MAMLLFLASICRAARRKVTRDQMTAEPPTADTGTTRRSGAGRRGEGSRRAAPLLPGAQPNLRPTAQRLLDAAHRLLVRSGYNSLSVEAIGQEAGENKALIRYYFGSKSGLLVALTDSLISDTLWRARQRISGLSDTHDRVGVVADTVEAIVDDEASYRLLFDLLPRLLENPRMTRQLADLYRGYRDVNARVLWGDRAGDPPPIVRELAAMTVALTDGLAVQVLAEPGSVDVRSVLDTWRSFMETVLASTSGGAAGPEAGADPEKRRAL